MLTHSPPSALAAVVAGIEDAGRDRLDDAPTGDAGRGPTLPAVALHEALLGSTVYCERPERPGFRALGEPGGGVVCVFSAVEELARARGPVGWFSITGSDLLERLPAGYDLLLDPASVAIRLRPAAVGRSVAIDISADRGPVSAL